MATYTKAERATARDELLRWIKPGDTIYLTVESVSRSGMSRWIKPRLLVAPWPGSRELADFRYPAYHVARLLGLRYDQRNNSVRMDGCGMDMGFALVSELAHGLFGTPGQYEASPETCAAAGNPPGTPAERMLRHRWI